MDKLGQITTLLKLNGINTVAKQLKIKNADIYKFLKDNGLSYVDGKVKPITDIQTEIAIERDKISESTPLERIIQKYNKDIDVESLKELISLIEPIKEIIKNYNYNKNIIEIDDVALKPKNIIKVKQKLFKIDVEVLDKWDKFIAEHKQHKVQNLISLALEEFIDKYTN